MDLIPVFKIGLLNAWILELYFLLPALIFSLPFMKKKSPANPDISGASKRELRLTIISKIIMFLPIIYSIFLPFKLGTPWFYIGLPICLLGLILLTISFFNFATAPINEPLTKGLYRYSRHPVYITQTLMFIGVSIASASWIFILFTILRTVASFMLMSSEERFCIKKYGDTYREYMNRTPRWIGFPKQWN